jgi:excisionase family DNA binding protein
MKKRYANIKEVSEYTSLPVKTLYDWASQGKIPSIKYGSRVLFDLHDIDQIMTSLKRNTVNIEKTANKIIGDVFCENV